MSKNIVLALAVLITTVAVSGGVIMAQQYQARSSSNTNLTATSTCPCGGNCNCATNGQPCSCGQDKATCNRQLKQDGTGPRQCQKINLTPTP